MEREFLEDMTSWAMEISFRMASREQTSFIFTSSYEY
jgi:hypothetical protein